MSKRAIAYTPKLNLYSGQGVSFGTNTYLSKASALSGVSDGPSGLVSVWVLNPNAAGLNRRIFSIGTPTTMFAAAINTSGRILFSGYNAAVVLKLDFASETTAFASMDAWSHVLASWNLTTARVQFYTDDVSDLGTNNSTLDDIVYSSAIVAVAANPNGAARFVASMADLQIWFNVDVDISVVANRRLFIDAAGGAVSPAVAAATLGTPVVLQSGQVSGWETNDGTGGGFTLNSGPLEAASSNPP